MSDEQTIRAMFRSINRGHFPVEVVLSMQSVFWKILPRFYQRVDVVASSSARLVLRQELDMGVPKSGPWELPGLDQQQAERIVVV